VDEDVLALVALADQEAVAAQPVEPFDPDRLERPRLIEQSRRIDPVDMAGGVAARLGHDRPAEIDAQHLARLQAPFLLGDQAFDDRAFGQAAAVMLLEHAEMDEDVAFGLVADDEAEATGGVEPFDGAAELDQRLVVARRFIALRRGGDGLGSQFLTRHNQQPINHGLP
jgi:hypothetical protein